MGGTHGQLGLPPGAHLQLRQERCNNPLDLLGPSPPAALAIFRLRCQHLRGADPVVVLDRRGWREDLNGGVAQRPDSSLGGRSTGLGERVELLVVTL